MASNEEVQEDGDRAHSEAPRTPPHLGEKRTHSDGSKGKARAASEGLDSQALHSALRGLQGSGRTDKGSGSPSRKRQRVYGDRFIPNREGQDLQASYALMHDDGSPSTPSKSRRRPTNGELHYQKTEEANRLHASVLRQEYFGDSVPQPTPPQLSPTSLYKNGVHSLSANDLGMSHSSPEISANDLPPASMTPATPHRNLFSFSSPQHLNISGHPTPSRTPSSRYGAFNLNPKSDLYSTTPVRQSSQQLLLNTRKQPRVISKVPFKVLDAPDLADDFYLNLVDWGSANILGVGLGQCVYMWNSSSGKVTKLCELQDDTVTSVSWIQRGSHIALGTGKGLVQIWDAEQCRRLRTMTGHTARVGALAWNDHILTSGSRDRLIYHRDVRSPNQHLRKLVGHRQEVCGLRWNNEDGQLASGGNDNKLLVWDKLNDTPLWKFSDHNAAVKAITWSPHVHHLLASGGGTADRHIRFWDTKKGVKLSQWDSGSQVCNLAWSKNSNEIVSTHGFSQNQITVWKYPKMEQVVSLTGHTYRVLYLAMSPDGQTIVTGAGDETLRFWKCFGKKDRDGVLGEGGGGGGGSGKMEQWNMIR